MVVTEIAMAPKKKIAPQVKNKDRWLYPFIVWCSCWKFYNSFLGSLALNSPWFMFIFFIREFVGPKRNLLVPKVTNGRFPTMKSQN